ncbi:MAG: (d)CMP kinase [Alphaproteobacteria bacterium]|nr:(d)CMP kinase [Alphaproteobacteria bacterium]
MVITVDGPAASGKGTLARTLAAELGLPHLDTGRIYRGVGVALLAAGQDPSDPAAAEAAALALDPAALGDPALASEAAARAASVVAAMPRVRAALLAFQRRFAAGPRGAVLDGRDTGTVICPEAKVKLFLTATAEERARRRHDELRGRGEASIYADVLVEIIARDRRDRTRAVAPLEPASDAVVIDTTRLDAAAVFEAALVVLRARGLYPAGPRGSPVA